MSAAAYFVPESGALFRATEHVGGGWNPDEQHVAPGMGLLAHAIERDRDARRCDGLRLTRFSCEILGTMPMSGPVEVGVSVLRPGRTVELVEARLSHAGRAGLIARAWLTQPFDTASIAGSALPDVTPLAAAPPWDAGETWPGGFVRSVECRRIEEEPGRATFWLRPACDLIEGVAVSPVARMLGVVDLANGVTPRVSAERALFPNLDLAAHLIREPRGEWLAFDTTVSFGPDGAGVTTSVVHDESGPVATVAQGLTVRPR